jgi:hypothetical protein
VSLELGSRDVVSQMTTARDFIRYTRKPEWSHQQVVKRFALQLGGVSSDGVVHSDGEILCCRCRPVARWWQGTMYLRPERGSDGEPEREVRGLVKGLL